MRPPVKAPKQRKRGTGSTPKKTPGGVTTATLARHVRKLDERIEFPGAPRNLFHLSGRASQAVKMRQPADAAKEVVVFRQAVEAWEASAEHPFHVSEGTMIEQETKAARVVVEGLRGTPDEEAARLLYKLEQEAERPTTKAEIEAFARHFEELAFALRAAGVAAAESW